LFINGTAELRDYFGHLPFFLMLFAPAIAMRLWSEERKLGTLEILLTLPIKTWQVVLAKWLAALAFLAVILLLTFPLPLALYLLGNPDSGPIIGGYLGSLILGMVYLAAGSFASSLTGDQIVAFVVGFSINLIFFLMGYSDLLDWIKDFSPQLSGLVERFGIQYHFESVTRGVVDSRDIIYALTVAGFFLFLNTLVLERKR
jgi:ABC-2 type transport system permease protein